MNPTGKTSDQSCCCGHCRHFCNTPAALEAAFPGLSVMSSGYASVRSQDGLCQLHGYYLGYRDSCGQFSPPEKPEASA